MTSILCLAHYCDLHGPTPLMVTEGLPVPCSICCDDASTDGSSVGDKPPRPRAPTSGDAAHAANITEALGRLDFASASQRASSSEEAQAHRGSLRRAAGNDSAIETPPQSPRLSHGAGAHPKPSRQDSGFRRTYDDYVTRRAGPCENCALTIPKSQEAGGDALLNPLPDRGPTLRTRAPCARVFTGIDAAAASPPLSQSSSSAPSDDESTARSRPSHRRTGTALSITSRSSASSVAANANSHMHFLDYTSTHEPLTPSSFSLRRRRRRRRGRAGPGAGGAMPTPILLPPSGGAGAAAATTSPPSSSGSFVTTHSVGAAASGGSIFFGDKKVGYTTAYIFRVPDVHARGHKRVYAFLALSTYPEATAVKTFSFLSAAFRDLAGWIQELAEVEAERLARNAQQQHQQHQQQHHEQPGGAAAPSASASGFGTSYQSEAASVSSSSHAQQGPLSGTSNGGGGGGGASSFLTGGGGLLRRMGGGGFGGAGVPSHLKQRGLAELVGLPDFFIQLHAQFVRLLLEIGVVVGS
ncbi:hypothetical protein VTJ83DRAFT_3193 [Remersonia thermophila]|uniref:Folliculin/SMCR8 longin domain-containing protein n=1 Tax=Remersonia thermophila TaxID=72144 RepID=A0ABR4DDM0_9PEZI